MNVERESARARVTFIWCADLLPTDEHPGTLSVPAWILTRLEGCVRTASVPRLCGPNMIHLLHTGAVPFGYVRNMSDTYLSRCDEDCLSTTMNHHRLSRTEPFQLPDVVLSNTPPPSPGHQVCGCRGAHPCKSWTQTQPLCSYSAPRNTHEDAPKGVTEEEVAKAELTEAHDTWISVQSYLPQLWSVPHQSVGAVGIPAHAQTPRGRHSRKGEQEQWRHIGRDLRKAADHFQLYASKKWRKNKPPVSLALPANVCRCVVASLVCLAWWRLYNKLY